MIVNDKNTNKNDVWSYYLDWMVEHTEGTRDNIEAFTYSMVFLWLCIVSCVLFWIIPDIRPTIVLSCSCSFLLMPFAMTGIFILRYRNSRRDEYFDEKD